MTVTLSDIPIDSPDREILFLLAQAISRGDTSYRTRDGRGAGAWGMAVSVYGQPAASATGQAAVAARLWRDLREGIARDLPATGDARMVALALTAWFAPGTYVTACRGTTAQDVLARAGLGSWSGPVLAAGAMAPAIMGCLTPAKPAGDSSSSSSQNEVASGDTGTTWVWLAAFGAAGVLVWWWYKHRPGA